MDDWLPSPSALRPAPGQVHVWRAGLDAPDLLLDRLAAQTLAPDEQARAGRFRFAIDRRRFIARRLLLRAILGGCLGCAPQALVYRANPYGKPALVGPAGAPGLCFSASHSAGLALVAVAVERELGVDLEQMRLDFDHAQVAGRFYSPAEQTALRARPPIERPAVFFAIWARKEAYVKALGMGLSLPLADFDVSPDDPARLLAARHGLPGPEAWSLHRLAPAPGYAGALCVQGRDWGLHTWAVNDLPEYLAGAPWP